MTSRRLASLVLAIAAGASPIRAATVENTDPLTPEAQQKLFQLPAGFEIQLVVSEPAIGQPMNLTFDAAGRLWVTHTIEYPYPARGDVDPNRGRFPGIGDHDPRDAVTVLEGLDARGKPSKITRFAEGLSIPIGVVPLRGGRDALVYSIPNILHLKDTDGDGRADVREKRYGRFGNVDVHGMASSFNRWIDGWIYGCHGFSNRSEVRDGAGRVTKLHSGNTYRFRADGSFFEQRTWGQVNPFGMTFDPYGNLFNADCHSKPLTQLLTGAYYPSFGKPHDGLGFGPNMISHSHGSTGICGPAYYAAAQFPAEYRDSLFLCNPVTSRVHRDTLDRHGSTLLAREQPDFITCKDPWFRPVDLKVGPDGALYIADFYNAVIGHYEAPLDHPKRDRTKGRIWRVVYTGEGIAAPGPDNLTTLGARALIDRLAHPNLTVRTLATHQLVERIGAPAVEALQTKLSGPDAPAETVAHGLWALERQGALGGDWPSRLAQHRHPLVRTHAVKMLDARRDWTPSERNLAQSALADADPFVRRAAAEALAAHPQRDQIRPLLQAWSTTPPQDTHLQHALRIALRNQLRAPGAYDDLPADGVTPLAEASLGVKRPEAATWLLEALAKPEMKAWQRRQDAVRHAARYLPEADLSRFDVWMTQADLPALTAAAAGLRARGRDLNDASKRRAVQLIEADLARNPQAAIDRAKELKLKSLAPALIQIARNRQGNPKTRQAALRGAVELDRAAGLAAAHDLVADASEPPAVRRDMAEALRGDASAEGVKRLRESIVAAPRSLAPALGAALASTPPGAAALLEEIERGRVSALLLKDRTIENIFKFHPALAPRVQKFTADLPPIDPGVTAKIAQRIERFREAEPDPARGKATFATFCAACHKIADEGGAIAPALDGVGGRGLERLVEDIVDPSRNVDEAFRTTMLELKDGRTVAGIGLRREGETLILSGADAKPVHVSRDEVARQTSSPLSLMPAIFGDAIPEAAFNDLLAYLLEQRPKD